MQKSVVTSVDPHSSAGVPLELCKTHARELGMEKRPNSELPLFVALRDGEPLAASMAYYDPAYAVREAYRYPGTGPVFILEIRAVVARKSVERVVVEYAHEMRQPYDEQQ